jgi:hypothetical protein
MKFTDFIKFNTKHILVSPKLFKERCFELMYRTAHKLIRCNTEKGKQVHRYYFDIIDIMELYIQYQNKLIEDRKKADKDRKKADKDRKKADKDRKKADKDRKKADKDRKKLVTILIDC